MHGVPTPVGNGRLASSAKPHPENDHHLSQTEEKGVYRNVGTLSPDQVKVTNRPDPSGWCERRTVSLIAHGRLLDYRASEANCKNFTSWYLKIFLFLYVYENTLIFHLQTYLPYQMQFCLVLYGLTLHSQTYF